MAEFFDVKKWWWVVVALVVMLFIYAWIDGGQQPVRTITQQVPLPETKP